MVLKEDDCSLSSKAQTSLSEWDENKVAFEESLNTLIHAAFVGPG